MKAAAATTMPLCAQTVDGRLRKVAVGPETRPGEARMLGAARMSFPCPKVMTRFRSLPPLSR